MLLYRTHKTEKMWICVIILHEIEDVYFLIQVIYIFGCICVFFSFIVIYDKLNC